MGFSHQLLINLITESEVVTGKSQTEPSSYWPSDSEVNTLGRGLIFSHNDWMVKVIKLFIIWHTKIGKKAKASAAEMITLHPIVHAQAHNQPVGITGE